MRWLGLWGSEEGAEPNLTQRQIRSAGARSRLSVVHRRRVGRAGQRRLRHRQPGHRADRRPRRRRPARPGTRGRGGRAREAFPAWRGTTPERARRAAQPAGRRCSSGASPTSCRSCRPRPARRCGSRRRCRCRSASSAFRRYAEARDAGPRHPAAAAARCRNTALAPGGLIGALARPAAGRRRRLHHPVQLPAGQHGRQGRARAGDGQHRRREAGAAGPAGGAAVRRGRSTRPASRRASSTSSPARAPRPAQALVDSPTSTWSASPAARRSGSASREAAGRGMKRLLLELGGKGAAIVFDDADLDRPRSPASAAPGRSTPARSARRRPGSSRTARCTTSWSSSWPATRRC